MPRERVAALHDAPGVEHARECTLGCVALEEVNSLEKSEFVARLGGVFEHSPWIAERAWHKRPFHSLDDLHRVMLGAVASEEEKLKLVRAHPELACGAALSVPSTSEQARLGFNALSREELEQMNRLNRSYREKFGFPCIVALRRHATRKSVMAEMAHRLQNSSEEELRAAMQQIGHITRGRLEKILNG
jgi:2-oxo-4-hydroxy-4-carboxy-5-ureidoimidazoline decarboxylase